MLYLEHSPGSGARINVVNRVLRLLPVLALGPGMALAAEQERIVESIIPALAYGPACSSVVELRNLSDRPVAVNVEGHRPSGALVAMTGHPSTGNSLEVGTMSGSGTMTSDGSLACPSTFDTLES